MTGRSGGDTHVASVDRACDQATTPLIPRRRASSSASIGSAPFGTAAPTPENMLRNSPWFISHWLDTRDRPSVCVWTAQGPAVPCFAGRALDQARRCGQALWRAQHLAVALLRQGDRGCSQGVGQQGSAEDWLRHISLSTLPSPVCKDDRALLPLDLDASCRTS